jgi:hypothetical protein
MTNWVLAFRARAINRKRTELQNRINKTSRLKPPPCTQEELQKLLKYDPEIGAFIWIGHKYTAHNGKIAGGKHKATKHVYWEIKVFGKKYKAHNLAYYYMTGIWTQIDHRNNKTLDNRFCNLRPANDSENGKNKLITKNSCKYKGVSRVSKSNKFQASITVNYKSIYLGIFDTPEEAYAAYCEAASKHHKEFANIRNE